VSRDTNSQQQNDVHDTHMGQLFLALG